MAKERVIPRSDTAGRWANTNPQLAKGEIVFTLDEHNRPASIKIGQGIDGAAPEPKFSDLPFALGAYPRTLQRGVLVYDYEPGSYGDGLVVVQATVEGKPGLYKLATSQARPFASTDFAAELAAGTWQPTSQPPAPAAPAAPATPFEIGDALGSAVQVGKEYGLDAGNNHATGLFSLALGQNNSASGAASFAAGLGNQSSGRASFAFGNYNSVGNDYAAVLGNSNQVFGDYAFAAGYNNQVYGAGGYALGDGNTVWGNGAAALGRNSTANGDYSVANGINCATDGQAAHAEGFGCNAQGNFAHSEGYLSAATGQASHAEGSGTVSSGSGSHAEGGATFALGSYSHAEGNGTQARATNSHVEGQGSQCAETATASHVSGYYGYASDPSERVLGGGCFLANAVGQAQHFQRVMLAKKGLGNPVLTAPFYTGANSAGIEGAGITVGAQETLSFSLHVLCVAGSGDQAEQAVWKAEIICDASRQRLFLNGQPLAAGTPIAPVMVTNGTGFAPRLVLDWGAPGLAFYVQDGAHDTADQQQADWQLVANYEGVRHNPVDASAPVSQSL